MDNAPRNPAAASDDRFLGESMLRRIANFGLDRNANQTKHWMPDSAGKRRFSVILAQRLHLSLHLGKECYDCQEKFTHFRRRHHCNCCSLSCLLHCLVPPKPFRSYLRSPVL